MTGQQPSRGLTVSLLVCVAAAGAAVGALVVGAGSDSGGEQVADGDPEAVDAGATGGYGDDDTSSTDAPVDAAPTTLTIADFDFASVAASPGTTVAVVNRDDFPHTVTARDGSFDTGDIDSGGEGSFVAPTAPGSYQITCSIHPQMTGAVVVG